MKRKILQLAETTQAITLPRSWAVENKLERGEKVEVEEQGNLLLVNTNKQLDTEVEIEIS